MKLLIADIPHDTTARDLAELFGTKGEVISVTLPVDHVTGLLKGTAIVEMATRAEAEDAVKHLHHRSLRGRRLRVRLAEAHEFAEVSQPLLIEEEHPAKPYPAQLPHRPERSPGR
jgi:RNA recognition motif-containing protein